MLVLNLVVIAFVVFLLGKKPAIELSIIKQLVLLEIIWICILLMTGLLFTFSTLEVKNSNQSFAETAGTETMHTFYFLGAFLIVHLAIAGTLTRHVFITRNK